MTAPGDVERRAHCRVPDGLPVGIRAASVQFPGRMVDISEGGMRCLVSHSDVPPVGDQVEVAFTVGPDEVATAACVVRSGLSTPAYVELGLTFTGMSSGQVERVRRHVSDRKAHIHSLGLD
jgi:hypothetical protein